MLWVNSHFRDFESYPEMMDFLEKFEAVLEEQVPANSANLTPKLFQMISTFAIN